MKNLNLMALGIAAGAWLVLPAVSRAGLVDTPNPHNFVKENWNISAADPKSVCGPCHQAHNANSTVVPLWGHLSSVGPWIMYSALNSPTFKAQPSQSATPTSSSLACLSCHDGTVAVNAMAGGGFFGGTAAQPIQPGSTGYIGTDLTHSHPISFTYDANLVGTGPNQDQFLYNPDNTQVLQPDDSPFFPGNDMTINGFLLGGKHRLECSSCHNVHNQLGSPWNAVNNPSLVIINGTAGGVGSLLCRSCHNK